MISIALDPKELDALIEALKWGMINYEDRAQRYMHIKGYRENEFEPKMKLLNDIQRKARDARRRPRGSKIKDQVVVYGYRQKTV
jgi:hypothetical protein